MNTAEVRTLLRYAAGLDRWLRETDPEAGQMMVAGWASMLADVPLDFAQRAVRDHYSQPDARSVTPGDLAASWRDQQHRERQRAADQQRAVDVQEALDAGTVAPMFGSAAEYLADMLAAVKRGEDPATVKRPPGVRVLNLSPEAEARERACAFPSVCICTHLECRAGYLDAPASRTNALGKTYEAVKRCPICEEGVMMAQETGVARRPRRTTTAR